MQRDNNSGRKASDTNGPSQQREAASSSSSWWPAWLVSPSQPEQQRNAVASPAPKPSSPAPVVEKKRVDPNHAIRWPSHANATFRDPTAAQRSQTRQTEQSINKKVAEIKEQAESNPDSIPVVGPFLGAKREFDELRAGKEPDTVTALRATRTVVAMTPAGYFPGASLPVQMVGKAAVTTGMGKAVDAAKQRQNSSGEDTTI